ncbi:MAG: aminotransferase class III-fold pyridoxal phosphate-dependent enzyme, partial [Oscillospiraceae bacterium]|nr:aminotransferase class III-fold pyridoxal phosphate-dependent enzyme [Oscillospiraceae bacterium]
SDDAWVAAVTAQLGKVQHTSNLYFTEPCARLAQLLCERTGMKKVFFSNSGAEANECAIKAARRYAEQKYPGRENVIITLKNSFHGRTITTLSATGQDTFHTDFLPMTQGFVHTPANDIDALTALFRQYNVAGFMFEAVQGEGGVLPLDKEFVQAAAELCKKHDALLMADEVQTGNGRTGMLYGYMNFDVQPDVVSTAKGLAGGLPLGATMLGEKAADVFTPGSHGSTFGGNPVCCAGAISIFERIDDTLMADVRAKSQYIFDSLTGAPGIKSVSGMGLMIGIETVGDAGAVVKACMDAGVLVLTAKTKVRLLPALNIPMELVKEAVEVIKTVCQQAM